MWAGTPEERAEGRYTGQAPLSRGDIGFLRHVQSTGKCPSPIAIQAPLLHRSRLPPISPLRPLIQLESIYLNHACNIHHNTPRKTRTVLPPTSSPAHAPIKDHNSHIHPSPASPRAKCHASITHMHATNTNTLGLQPPPRPSPPSDTIPGQNDFSYKNSLKVQKDHCEGETESGKMKEGKTCSGTMEKWVDEEHTRHHH